MSKKRSSGKTKGATGNESPDKYLLHYLKSHTEKVVGKSAVLRKMLKKYPLEAAELAIQILEAQNKIEILQGKHIRLIQSARKGTLVEGRIDMTKTGAGFLVSPTLDRDAYIPAKGLNTALDGDLVRVELYKDQGRPEGSVVEILKRYKTQFIGTVQVNEKFAFLIPVDDRMPYDIFIPLSKLNGAKNGDKALADLVRWDPGMKNPEGAIKELVSGEEGKSHDIEMKSVLLDNGFKIGFPDMVIEESEAISDRISEEELAKRLDYREIPTFTIDPIDAKDFDDALSVRQLENGNWEIGVHIADVSHFVKPGSALDKEALERATSVYLPDRVSPMFPERLSNFICSLRPQEEKCVFSVIFEFDHRSKIKNYTFGKAVIKSFQRFAYEEVQQILEGEEHEYKEQILVLDKVAKALRKERFSKGSVNFDAPEVRFKLDEAGNPIDVFVKVRKDAHLLVEDFMLLANKTVAMYVSKLKVGKRKYPMVYRVHDLPDMNKLEMFSQTAKRFGYDLRFEQVEQVAGALNEFFKLIHGRPEQNILEQLAIRSMAKAVYTTNNIGHYGLGFEYYTHFTSPIRRYPDVLAHRILEECLEEIEPPITEDDLEEQCEHSSHMERCAQLAEREATKYMQCLYLMNRIGEEYDGIISGVISSGIFVELKANKCEGFIPQLQLGWDTYVYDEERFCLTGKDSGVRFNLGDEIKVIVAKVNLQKREIEFEPAEAVED